MNRHSGNRNVHIFNRSTGESSNAVQPPTHSRGTTMESTTTLTDLTESKTEVPNESRAPSATGAPSSDKGLGKSKFEITSLEQLIAHAYARKGQRLAMTPKIEREIVREPRLDANASVRLMKLADADVLLAVPRQLLLVGREVSSPVVREEIGSYVTGVMLRHPVFAVPAALSLLQGLPEATTIAGALTALMNYEAERGGNTERGRSGTDARHSTELKMLRRNASSLFATWWACRRGFSQDVLATQLSDALWEPAAARELTDDNARLRALTEVDQPAVLGLVAQAWRQQASNARAAADRAERSAETARGRAEDIQKQMDQLKAEVESRNAELSDLKASAAKYDVEMRHRQEAERMHLQHKLELLRGRLVRRLKDSVEMLEVGLTALRNKTPRTEVMIERAEHVVDALRAELGSLREE